jgi:hypothetical protein
MKGKGKKKSWEGFIHPQWQLCCGFSGNEFILCEITKLKMSDATRKVKITVEEL